jgi:hypothetical protein
MAQPKPYSLGNNANLKVRIVQMSNCSFRTIEAGEKVTLGSIAGALNLDV